MLVLSPISAAASWLSLVLVAGILIWGLLTSQWQALFSKRERWNLWLIASIALGLFWGLIGISLEAALRFHPLLMTSLCLVFGFRLSVIGGALAMVICTWLSFLQLSGLTAAQAPFASNPLWQNFSYNLLLGVVIPAAITYGIFRALARLNIQNLFIYTLGVGFAGGMVTMVLSGGCALLLAHGFNELHLSLLADNSHLFMLLAFPEGFCNGALISTLAVLAPEMVKTYDHDFYLR